MTDAREDAPDDAFPPRYPAELGETLDEAGLLALLDALEVSYAVHRHPPLFTVEDSQALRGDLPGAHVKNMFLKDKTGQLWLVTCLEDRAIRIRDLEKAVGARKMSFGKPEVLWRTLGVKPGAVTPLALVNDRKARAIRFVVDAAILSAELVNCHPLHNEATVALSAEGLRHVAAACGHEITELDFDALEAAAADRA